jgi:uncharacterized protein YndB with AHSA1/START domain
MTSSESSINVAMNVTIAAEPLRVFSALTTGVSMWWGFPYIEREDASDLVMEPRLGGRFLERWSRDGTENHGALLGLVVAIDKPRLLRIQGSFGMSKNSILGLLSIELTATKEGTLLHLTFHAHGNFDEGEQLRFGRGWHDLAGRLKFFVEEGHAKGVRYDPSLQSSFDIID